MQSRLHAMRLLKRGRSRDGGLLSPSASPRGSAANIFSFQDPKLTAADGGQNTKFGRRLSSYSSSSSSPNDVVALPPTTKKQLRRQEDRDFKSVARIMYMFLALVAASVLAFVVYTVVRGTPTTVM